MKKSTLLFVLWLPLMVLVTIVGWTIFGALPGAAMTGDLVAWLLELPVTTCYALASVGSASVIKHVFLSDLTGVAEDHLHERVAAGDTNARWLIVKDRLEWLGLLILSGLFFFPHWS